MIICSLIFRISDSIYSTVFDVLIKILEDLSTTEPNKHMFGVLENKHGGPFILNSTQKTRP